MRTTTIQQLISDAKVSITIGEPYPVTLRCNKGHDHSGVCQFRYGQYQYWMYNGESMPGDSDYFVLTPCSVTPNCDKEE